jgi:hypothetical protein
VGSQVATHCAFSHAIGVEPSMPHVPCEHGPPGNVPAGKHTELPGYAADVQVRVESMPAQYASGAVLPIAALPQSNTQSPPLHNDLALAPLPRSTSAHVSWFVPPHGLPG